MFDDNDLLREEGASISSDVPAKNAMDCLEPISELLKKLSPADTSKPVKLNEKQIDTLLSLKGDFEFHKKRIIVVAATSYFEEQITNTIHKIYEKLNDAVLAEHFFKTLFARKYHGLFDFERIKEEADFYPNVKKINYFFKYFGKNFDDWLKEHYIKTVKKKWEARNPKGEKILHSIECFLLLNSIRNKIVHGGYNAVDSIIHAKGSEKFYNNFINACNFINWLPWAIEESEKWRKRRHDREGVIKSID